MRRRTTQTNRGRTAALVAALVLVTFSAMARSEDNVPPEGFDPLFNGKDLTAWQGMESRHMKPDKVSPGWEKHWTVEDGVITFRTPDIGLHFAG